ncbi:LacI family DNA-binding transcriptional regulator [Spiroplasma alleghenense]|uniref:LacI family transcriptional regulator n=1 Tax=Spiroplasma alleghenense TaxID=216931 RepID=A0A345Z517_9MOLU|nr:LacI family DNA-binding transcriptional regulator [Spiroplasma alleghenense]AXK51696.1 LacI family transcriptional regulator [Spiroplasma alleghenense]
MKKLTIVDIAKMAGVNPSTVSRVLNNDDRISQETKFKVNQIIEQTGFEKNKIASALRSSNSKNIGIIIPNLKNPFYNQLLSSMHQTVAKLGYQDLILDFMHDKNYLTNMVSWLKNNKIDGLVFTSEQINSELEAMLVKLNIPIMLVATSHNQIFSHAIIDNFSAMKEITQAMLDSGKNNLAMVSFKRTDIIAGLNRQDGYIKANENNNFTDNIKRIVEISHSSFDNGYQAAKQIIESDKNINGIVCGSDLLAVGVINYILDQNLRIPEDIAVSGFDNLDFSRYCRPKISTIDQNLEYLGRIAIQNLINEIKTGEKTFTSVEYKLISRESI